MGILRKCKISVDIFISVNFEKFKNKWYDFDFSRFDNFVFFGDIYGISD